MKLFLINAPIAPKMAATQMMAPRIASPNFFILTSVHSFLSVFLVSNVYIHSIASNILTSKYICREKTRSIKPTFEAYQSKCDKC